MFEQIHTYTELRKQIRAALRRQHPEWIDANGKSPLCDSYEARFTELLAILTPHGTRRSLRTHNEHEQESANHFQGRARDQRRGAQDRSQVRAKDRRPIDPRHHGVPAALDVGRQKPLPCTTLNLIMPRRHSSGSEIGGIAETEEMIDFCAEPGRRFERCSAKEGEL